MKQSKVSFGSQIQDVFNMETFALECVIDAIKSDEIKQLTTDYCAQYQTICNDFDMVNGDVLKTRYDDKVKPLKSNIPYVTFSGEFRIRNNGQLINHSNIIVIDIDNPHGWEMSNCENVEHWREALKTDNKVLFFFRSPTNGFKIGFRKPTNMEHADAYYSAMMHCKTVYNFDVDVSGKDVSRACFLSYDVNVWANYDCNELELIERVAESSNVGSCDAPVSLKTFTHETKPLTWITLERAVYVVKSLPKSHYDNAVYSDWLKVGLALHYQFKGNETALKIWQWWSSQDYAGYNDNGCIKTWNSFTHNGSQLITFTSLLTKREYGKIVSDLRDDLITMLIGRFDNKADSIREYKDIAHKMSNEAQVRLMQRLY